LCARRSLGARSRCSLAGALGWNNYLDGTCLALGGSSRILGRSTVLGGTLLFRIRAGGRLVLRLGLGGGWGSRVGTLTTGLCRSVCRQGCYKSENLNQLHIISLVNYFLGGTA